MLGIDRLEEKIEKLERRLEVEIALLQSSLSLVEKSSKIRDELPNDDFYYYYSASYTSVGIWVQRILDFLKSEGYTYKKIAAGGSWEKK